MELKSIIMITVLIAKLVTKSITGVNQAELEEVPRIGYNKSDFEHFTGYAYYGDTIIVHSTIYKIRDGEYRNEGTVQELVGIDEDMGIEYAQYKNLLIVNLCGHLTGEEFRVYDTDTWDYYPVADHMTTWCIYQRQLLYAQGERLCCVNLSDGKKREFDILNLCKDENLRIHRFGIREDGKIAVGKYNEENGCHEIWMLGMKDNGELEEQKIWETGEWEFGYWIDFNSYGVVLAGKRWMGVNMEWGTTKYEVVVVTEDGESRVVEPDLLGRACVFMDDGYFVCDETERNGSTGSRWNADRFSSSVSFYDYAGNKVDTYQMVSHELIGQGYYLTKLIYEDGKLTGFYVQEDTDRLYISQTDTELNK